MSDPGFVYIMANARNGTIYVGSTNDLPRRVWEHRNSVIDGFTRDYDCKLLVWYAAFDTVEQARRRERQMKKWRRACKIREIEGLNPDWGDLFDALTPL